MKYDKAIGLQIANAYATGDHSVKQICATVNITRTTYYRWLNNNKAFAALIESAKQLRYRSIADMALSGLAALVQPHEIKEESVEYTTNDQGEEVIKKRTVTKKTIMPNASAVQFALTNRLPEDWQHSSRVNFKDETERKLEVMSEADLDKIINAITNGQKAKDQ